MNDNLHILIKSADAAKELGLSRTTLFRHVKAGRLECVKFAPNSIYFTRQQLDEFVVRHRKQYNPRHLGGSSSIQE